MDIKMASQITGVSIVYATVCAAAGQRKHQSSASLAFLRGIHRWRSEFPAQRASNAQNVSIWWLHHNSISTVIMSYFYFAFVYTLLYCCRSILCRLAISYTSFESWRCLLVLLSKLACHIFIIIRVYLMWVIVSGLMRNCGISVALFLLQALVAIWYDFFNCMIQSKWNRIIHESTILIII